MRTNLLKILVTLCLVAGAVSCGGKGKNSDESGKNSDETSESEPSGPTKLTLAGLYERDTEPDDDGNYRYLYEDKEVIVSGLAVNGFYGDNVFFLTQNHWKGVEVKAWTDFSGVEVELKEGTKSDAWIYDVVTVTGIAKAVEERIVIKDAELEITDTAWQLNEDGTRTRLTDEDGNRIGSVSYYRVENRSIFSNLSAPLNSGFLVDVTLQFASIPERITTTSATSFMAVFAGENMDLEDDENEAPFEVRIPAGLREGVVDSLNAFLFPEDGEPVKVGDFAVVTGNLQFHTFGQGLIMTNGFAEFVKVANEPVVLSTFAELYDEVGGENILFHDGMFDFGTALDDAGAFSYVPDVSTIGTTVGDEYGDYEEDYPEIFDKTNEACQIFIEDWENAAYFSYTVNVKDMEAAEEAILASFEDTDYVRANKMWYDSAHEDIVDIIVLVEGGDEDFKANPVVHQLIFNYHYSAKQIVIEEMGEAPFFEGSVEDALDAMYATNNATYVAALSAGTLYTMYTNRSMLQIYGEQMAFYTMISGKFEKDGLYALDFETLEFALALEIPAGYDITNVMDGAPANLADWLSFGEIAEDDKSLTLTGEDLSAALTELVEEEEVETYLGYAIDTFADVVALNSAYVQTLDSVELKLSGNNIFKFTVNFTYEGSSYSYSATIMDVGETDLSTFEELVDALPDYVPAEGGEGGEGGEGE